MKLEDIGFYTLSDQRAKTASPFSELQRVEILITDKCNFNCPYCRGSDCGEEDAQYIYQIINRCAGCRGLKNIRFSGGEPTLHPDIKDIVRYAKFMGVERIAISTNGSADLELYKELIELGVNDFSISLDACCDSFGDEMAGVKGYWSKITNNIAELSQLTYVSVGVVITKETADTLAEVVEFASSLGVADIRVISSAQYNTMLEQLKTVDWNLLKDHPILRYRVMNTVNGRNVRGLEEHDSHECPLVLDDVAISGGKHYPCVIYMREQGEPIGEVGSNMWNERMHWWLNTDTHEDPICKKNCLDVCIDYNNKYEKLNSHMELF